MSSIVNQRDLLLIDKLKLVPVNFVIAVMLLYLYGMIALFSAGRGDFFSWPYKQLLNFVVALPLLFIIMLADIRTWFRMSYLLYFGGLGMLILVMIAGVEGGLGAQRWIAIGGFRFQPSEIAKVTLVVALARYFQNLHLNNLHKIKSLIIPIGLTGLCAGLVLIQPNLGTAAIICLVSGIIFFNTGLSWKKILIIVLSVLMVLPVLWANMHDYQKRRVDTFLNPEKDPLGAGYNIIQSKIAIGSGGMFGKGFLKGTQSQLNFVPEQQTDFIFSILAEEFGFMGSIILLLTYAYLFYAGLKISFGVKSFYGKTICVGMMAIIFVHVFVNIGMVSGILPVVGVPLPFISYGGSSLISSFIAMAFVVNAHIHQDTIISITEDDED